MSFRHCSLTKQELWLCPINFARLDSGVGNENYFPTSPVFASAFVFVHVACSFNGFGAGGSEGEGAKGSRKATGAGTQDGCDAGRGRYPGIQSEAAREPLARFGRRRRSAVDA